MKIMKIMKNKIPCTEPYRIIKYILGVILFPFFFVNKRDVPGAVVCSWFLVLIALCLCIYRDFKKAGPTVTKRGLRASIPVTILFLVMLSFEEMIKSPFFSVKYWEGHTALFRGAILFWAYALYLPAVCISAWIVIHTFFEVPEKGRAEAAGGTRYIVNETQEKQLFRLCMGIITALSLISVFSAFPGIWIEGDAGTVLRWAQNEEWSDWHPFPYLLFVWLGNKVFHSGFAINMFQTVVWLLLQYYILFVLKSVRIRCMPIYTVILCIASTPFTYLAVMYKDTLFSMGVLGITAALFRIIRNREMSNVDFLVLNVSALQVTLFRHAGQAVVILMCLSCIAFFWKNRKQLVRFAVTLGVQLGFYLLFGVILFQQFHVEKNPAYIKYGTPMAMIGAAVKDGMEFDDEDEEQLRKVMPVRDWGECYDKYWADPISRSYGTIGGRIDTVEKLIQEENYGSFLIKMNAKILAKNPKLYLRAFFDMNSILWEIGTPSDCSDMALCQVGENEQIRYTAFHNFTDRWWRFGAEMTVTHSLFQRGGVSLFIIVVFIVLLFRKKQMAFSIPLIAVIFHNLLLFITVPAQDPRYALPAIECAVFVAALLPAVRMLGEKRGQTVPTE